MNKKVEILSPAGSYESLVAAIQAGADAVYIGGKKFGARAFADNLKEDKMLEAIDYVHLHGKRIYLTVNTLLKENELRQELYEYLRPYYEHGIDAVIVQDIGVVQYIKRYFPDLPIHASTQMTVTNVHGAKFVEELGVERVVTAREMSLDEIREISNQTSLEIESFVHGALCYCYSGQCFYSSLIGGRSGNRGQCAQPCRLPYRLKGEKRTSYLMSLKDMCTLEHIPELIEAGINSFKIEGRMKKPEYVALVTAMYRKYVDLYISIGKDKFKIEKKDREMLMDLYNRGGFHDGYYFEKNGKQMLSLERPNHAGVRACKVIKTSGKNIILEALVDMNKGDVIEMDDERNTYTLSDDVAKGMIFTAFATKKTVLDKGAILNRTRNERLIQSVRNQYLEQKTYRPVNGKISLRENEPVVLEIICDDIHVKVEGDLVQTAFSQPLDRERVAKQLRKTGTTEFQFSVLDVLIDGNVFIPMQSLNELRRTAILRLEQDILSKYRRVVCENASVNAELDDTPEKIGFHVFVECLEQFEVALESSWISRIYLDCNAIKEIWKSSLCDKVIDESHAHKKQIYLGLPHIFRSHTVEIFETNYEDIFSKKWDGFLVRNLETYHFLRMHKNTRPFVVDHNLYQFNKEAKMFWIEKGAESLTAPLELNCGELQKVGLEFSELICYGYLPMMISAQCIQKTTDKCSKQQGRLTFFDRYNKDFSVKNQCDYCYNVIYNTTPLVLVDQKDEIMKLSPKALRLHFTLENKMETKKILELYKEVFFLDKVNVEVDFEYTRGHFKRGIK